MGSARHCGSSCHRCRDEMRGASDRMNNQGRWSSRVTPEKHREKVSMHSTRGVAGDQARSWKGAQLPRASTHHRVRLRVPPDVRLVAGSGTVECDLARLLR
jgi:hypothetical protein